MRIIPRRSIAHYKGELKDILSSILRGAIREGPCIEQFEKQFAEYIGTKYAIAVASGRLGLFLILDSLSLDKDSGVILPAYTDESVPGVIKRLGLEPVFIDIDQKTHNIDAGLIEEKVNEKTKVIIATHIFGRPCNLFKIMEIAKRHNLIVIEDCAHAIGAEYNAKRVGSIGNAAYFSFGITKPLNTFGGGMITTNDPVLYSGIKKNMENFEYPNIFIIVKNIFISYYLFLATSPLFFLIIIFPILYSLSFFNIDPVIIYNSTVKRIINIGRIKIKYTNIQALAGLKQLQRIDEVNKMRRLNAATLSRCLNRSIDTLQDEPATNPTYYFFVILTHNADSLSKKLLIKGIDTGKYIMRDCAARCGNNKSCVSTQEAISTSLQIPLYPQLQEKDIVYISGILNQIFNGSSAESIY